MKKKIIKSVLTAFMIMSVACIGCGEEKPTINLDNPNGSIASSNDTGLDESENTANDNAEDKPFDRSSYLVTATEPPQGYVYNELSGLLIDESIKKQRPLAVMVDNEQTALDHYGINDSDIVYEMVNSTLNGRITRLMCIIKDWGKIKQFGSVRSARTTNCYLAGEYNAILCHDGGPYYINDYVGKPGVDHLSGVFSRVSNGKPREFTEYICPNDLQKYIVNADNMSQDYTEYYTEDHFDFAPSDAMNLNTYKEEKTASDKIELPFEHNGSKLFYNKESNTYDYYEYGNYHKDAVTGEVLTFTNVIIQKAHMGEYDKHGYMVYDIVYNNGEGYYITDGKCVDITWEREGLTDNTIFRDSNGDTVVLNAGKTYIAIVPDDVWDEIKIN